jgi:hypothetical protein
MGRCSLELAQGPSRVALAWHNAGGCTPFGVTIISYRCDSLVVGSSLSLRGPPLKANSAVPTLVLLAQLRVAYFLSTVLAQDHFYSDFLSLSLTILTHKGSMMMIVICCGVERCLGVRHRWDEFIHDRCFEWILIRESCGR